MANIPFSKKLETIRRGYRRLHLIDHEDARKMESTLGFAKWAFLNAFFLSAIMWACIFFAPTAISLLISVPVTIGTCRVIMIGHSLLFESMEPTRKRLGLPRGTTWLELFVMEVIDRAATKSDRPFGKTEDPRLLAIEALLSACLTAGCVFLFIPVFPMVILDGAAKSWRKTPPFMIQIINDTLEGLYLLGIRAYEKWRDDPVKPTKSLPAKPVAKIPARTVRKTIRKKASYP